MILNINNKRMLSMTNQIDFEHLYTVEGYSTFRVVVVSGQFSGTSNFCVSNEKLSLVINNLTKIYEEFKGTCEMQDFDSDGFITFEITSIGHVIIKGQIGGSHEDQYLRFNMRTDQTILSKIISDIKSVI